MMKGSSLEAAFPLSAIAKYVVPGQSYLVGAYNGYNENGKFVSVDGPGSKKLQF